MAQLRLADPTACWEVRRFDGLPYLLTETGCFVEVAVTVQGVTLSQIHPVLDGRNRPILAPTAFDINTRSSAAWSRPSRCTGSGLYIYAGEDLPQIGTEPAANDEATGAAPTDRRSRPSPGMPASPVLRQPSARRSPLAQQAHDPQAWPSRSASSCRALLEYFGVRTLAEIGVGGLPARGALARKAEGSMSTIVQLVQGSEAWHAHRRGLRNASETPAVLGISPWVTPYQLWLLKTGRAEPTVNAAMRNGTALEPLARHAYEVETGNVMQPLVLQDGLYSASLDGMTLDGDLIVEIKVPVQGRGLGAVAGGRGRRGAGALRWRRSSTS